MFRHACLSKQGRTFAAFLVDSKVTCCVETITRNDKTSAVALEWSQFHDKRCQVDIITL